MFSPKTDTDPTHCEVQKTGGAKTATIHSPAKYFIGPLVCKLLFVNEFGVLVISYSVFAAKHIAGQPSSR